MTNSSLAHWVNQWSSQRLIRLSKLITDINLLFRQRKTAQIPMNMMLNFINEETS